MKPIHLLMLVVFAALFSFFMAVQLVHAEGCITPDQARKQTLASFPSAQIVDVSNAETQAFIKAYNAYPPQSDLKADTMQVNQLQGVPNVIVYFFTGECGAYTLPISQAQFMKFMTEALGNPT